MAKFTLSLALGLLAVLANGAQAGTSKMKNPRAVSAVDEDSTKTLVDWYDCSGKVDGNYIHPNDCTKFMSCVAQQYAYERLCATCDVDPDSCPKGRTHYDHGEDACLWAHEAGCVVDPPPAPTTTTTKAPEVPDPTSCDPDDCWVTGYCHEYSWCERVHSDHKGKGKNGTTMHGTCDEAENLYFNPNRNSIHGGVCDFWENLDETTKETYNNDPNCIDPHCEWRPDPDNECSSKYWYFHPEQNDGHEKEMHCPKRPDGESLLWDQGRKSCHPCNIVKDSKGNACC